MPKDDLPTYAIVELLMRLSTHETDIGEYKDHIIHNDGIIVKTTTGHISFSRDLIMQQFHEPEKITEQELLTVAGNFRSTDHN